MKGGTGIPGLSARATGIALAPLWVWALVGETVPAPVLWGGVVIIVALVMNAVAPGTREEPVQS